MESIFPEKTTAQTWCGKHTTIPLWLWKQQESFPPKNTTDILIVQWKFRQRYYIQKIIIFVFRFTKARPGSPHLSIIKAPEHR